MISYDLAKDFSRCPMEYLSIWLNVPLFTWWQCLCGSRAREIARRPLNVIDHKDKNVTQPVTVNSHVNGLLDHQKVLANHDHISSSSHMELAVNVFFKDKDLKVGNTIPIYFPIKEPSAKPPLLSREEADSIPFSSSQLPYLLQLFSFAKDSPQANAMLVTLGHCEFKPVNGETKFCATSLESMLDSARNVFGSNTPFKVLTTNHLTNQTTSILQNYTIRDEPNVISAPKIIACHALPYPYAVFYCHSQKSDNKLFKILLVGENGEKVDAAAVCHMDTSGWNPNHVAFRVLKTVPGSSPVCHFLPADNLVWVASTSIHY